MDGKVKSRKGQVAIWVIIAIVLAASILVFFLIRRGPTMMRPTEPGPVDIHGMLESCISQKVQEAESKMLPQGGFLNPRNVKRYNNTDVAYICENILSYDRCVNQHPMLIREMQNEIKGYISPYVADCIESLKEDAESTFGSVTLGNDPYAYSVLIKSERINVVVNKSMSVTKNGQTQDYKNFEVDVQSPMYGLAMVAMEIASQEALYCYFESAGYSLVYPIYDIKMYRMAESTKIYTIKDERTGKYMMVATRSCAIPSGLS